MALPAGDVSPLRSPFGFSPADVAHSPTAYAVKVRCIPRPDRVAPPNYWSRRPQGPVGSAGRAARVASVALCWNCDSDLGPARAPANDSASPPTPASWRSRRSTKSVSWPAFARKRQGRVTGSLRRRKPRIDRQFHRRDGDRHSAPPTTLGHGIGAVSADPHTGSAGGRYPHLNYASRPSTVPKSAWRQVACANARGLVSNGGTPGSPRAGW